MAEIGVDLKIKSSNKPTFFKRVQRGETQMFRLSWIADYPDAQNFLQVFYGPNAHASNRAAYDNPEYNKLYERAAVLGPCPERTRLYAQMTDILIEDCPWIFMHQPLSFTVTHSWVKNWVPHSFPYGLTKYRKVDLDARAEWLRKQRF
jgi:ABC-type transport system substrate-binding protein